jgi:predicted TIM-barrel fold metal-dependent hydrolase
LARSAAIEVVDAHHHLWDLGANYYPWLTDRVTVRVAGDYAAIRKDYLVSDFLADADSLGEAGMRLVGSVHVQAEHDHADPVRETRWLQGVADDPASRGVPQGIVAYADLAQAEGEVVGVLEGHAAASANLRGVRQMAHEALVDPAQPRPSLLDDAVWRRNVGLLTRFGLSFDLQVYPQQMAQAAGLVREHSEVQFVLCHTGLPAEAVRKGPRSEAFTQWRDGISLLAELPNVAIKLSGFGMFDREWSAPTVRPFVVAAIERFGPSRCMFASNFPVDSMACSYVTLWSRFEALTRSFSASERAALFGGTARRVYRV